MTETQIVNDLKLIPTSDGDNFVLDEDFSVYSETVGNIITVPKGFITDLESISRILVLTYALTKGKASRAAVVHDWIYRTHIYDKRTADIVFKELMVLCPALNAWEKVKLYKSVDWFGGSSYNEGPAKLLEQNPEIFKEKFPNGYQYKTIFKNYKITA